VKMKRRKLKIYRTTPAGGKIVQQWDRKGCSNLPGVFPENQRTRGIVIYLKVLKGGRRAKTRRTRMKVAGGLSVEREERFLLKNQ